MDYPGRVIGPGGGPVEVVLAIQERLVAAGVGPLSVDGVFGPDTEGAVRLFQARMADPHGHPLEVDGRVGPMTWATLFGAPLTVAAAPASPILARTLQVAAGEIGVLEDPPGSNRGARVEEYLRGVGLDGGYAWCAAFVHWCFGKATEGGPNPCPAEAAVHSLWAAAGRLGRLRYTPTMIAGHPELIRPGQLFFLDTGGGNGHVGFIEGVEGAVLVTIEGNTNDGGSREGVGVFRRRGRRIAAINLGVADMTQQLV